MVQIELPAYDADKHTCNGLEDCATPALSAYPTSNVVTAATQAFVDREPDAAALMQNLTFTNAQMGEVLAWQETNQASYEEAAVYFLTNYKDVWGSWLNDEAREQTRRPSAVNERSAPEKGRGPNRDGVNHGGI